MSNIISVLLGITSTELLTDLSILFAYLFEALDPVLHIEDFELFALLAGEARSDGDIGDRWLRKLLLVEGLLV